MTEKLDNLYSKEQADKWSEAKTMEHASGIWGRDPMLKYLQDQIIQPGDTVVDLGAGNGYPTMRVAQMVGEDGHVIGVERSTAMLGINGDETVNDRYKDDFPNIDFVAGDATHIPLKEQVADKVVSFMMLHNLKIEDVAETLQDVSRVLKEDGTAVFLTMSPKAQESDWDVDFMGYEKEDLDKLKTAEDKEGIKLRGFVQNSGGGSKQIGMFYHTEENLQQVISEAGLEIVSEQEIFVDEETAKEKFGDNSIRKLPTTPIFVIFTLRKKQPK